MSSATHSGSVVHDNSSDHAGAYGSGIGSELPPIWGEHPVDGSADDSWLKGYLSGLRVI